MSTPMTEPRFLRLGDVVLSQAGWLHVTGWAHHWPFSEVEGQLTDGTPITLLLGCTEQLTMLPRPEYPPAFPRETWSGYALACPCCDTVVSAPGLDPDDDPVGPIHRAGHLYRQHYDLAHRQLGPPLA